ncbi:MAG: hypothetical protein ACLFPO_00305 [Spirochaetaceae bacterium]
MMRTIAPALFALAAVTAGYTQSQVHGTVTSQLLVEPSQADGVSTEVRAERLVSLSIDQELNFLEGIQLEIRVPEAVRTTGGGFAVYLYDNVGPAPSAERTDYRGRRVFFRAMPAARRFFVTIPVSSSHALRETADTYLVDEVVGVERFPMLLAILPVMKGIPDSALRAAFTVTAKPLLLDIGAARVRISDPDGADILESPGSLREFELYLDGERIDYDEDPIALAPGLHRLSVESTRYDNQRLTFGVERGQVSRVDIQLEEPRSAVRFEAPDGVTLFVDGEEVDHDATDFSLPAGEHTVMFRIGEYTVSKRFAVAPKKSYEISLTLDILIDED